MKVTILFDENLVKVMSPDSKVSVSVGQRGSLDFTPQPQRVVISLMRREATRFLRCSQVLLMAMKSPSLNPTAM